MINLRLTLFCSKLEQEAEEKLTQIYRDLLEAGVNRNESEREARFRDTLANLQRIFPGVRGRVSDLCKPSLKKYELAVSVVLGRNNDAVIVDEEKTAIDCIEVSESVIRSQSVLSCSPVSAQSESWPSHIHPPQHDTSEVDKRQI